MPFGIPDMSKGIMIEKDSESASVDMPEMHSHPCHELYFLISGKRRYFIGHSIYDVVPGNLVVIPKNELHKTTSFGNKGYERYVMYFLDEDISELERLAGQKNWDSFINSGCLSFSYEHAEFMEQCFITAEKERRNPDAYTQLAMRNILYDIILRSMRFGAIKSRESNTNADKIQFAAKYISENYADEISLSEISQLAFMEETYFSKKFKKLTGFCFKEYLTQTRIKAAEKLLDETKLTVSEIADRCGFSSSNYFGDIFKHWKGCSPSEYRRLIRR